MSSFACICLGTEEGGFLTLEFTPTVASQRADAHILLLEMQVMEFVASSGVFSLTA